MFNKKCALFLALLFLLAACGNADRPADTAPSPSVDEITAGDPAGVDELTQCLPVSAFPGISGGSHRFSESVEVALQAESGSVITYTLDGSEPRTYSQPITLTGRHTLKAWAGKDGMLDSEAATFYFANGDGLQIDFFGQTIGDYSYDVKIPDGATPEEVAALWADDEEWLKQFSKPASWDDLGGLDGSKDTYGFEATGFFHIEQREENGKIRSYMVNPIGNLYFNISACVHDDGDTHTIVDGREDIYEWLADPSDSMFSRAYWDTWWGTSYSHYIVNWARKNGKPYDKPEFLDQSVVRMRSLGFNGLGGWSAAYDRHMAYYYWPIQDIGVKIGDSNYFDVFDPDFERALDEHCAHLAGYKDDPTLMGYLMGNERDYLSFRGVIFSQDESSPAKRRLVEMLRAKYASIDEFNAAWDVSQDSWDTVLNTDISTITVEGINDYYEYLTLYFDTYFGLVTQYIRKYDPNHMVMGERIVNGDTHNPNVSAALYGAMGRHLDVISLNYYRDDPRLDLLESLYEIAGHTPFVSTEFHFGDASGGLSRTGIVMSENEEEKGKMYRNYVEKLAASGMFVGVDWFQYLDQSPTGRYFDGEDGALGFFNVADRPYRTVISHAVETNYTIYDVIQGKRPPFEFQPE